MTAPTALRPAPYHPERAVTFTAWRNSTPASNAALLAATTFDEAIEALTPHALHRSSDVVVTILRTDFGRGNKTLALYGFKKSTKSYTWRAAYDGGRPVKVPKIVPVLLHAMDVHEFAPVEPFDATRDDPVGVDRQLVEVRHG